MKNNPYNELLNIIDGISQNNNSPSIQIGKVLLPPPEISVLYNGIELKKEEIYISEYLLVGYSRTARGHIVSGTQPANCPSGSPHTHPIDNDYNETFIFTDTLKAGDYVSIMPVMSSDGSTQQYIILDKIVRLDGK